MVITRTRTLSVLRLLVLLSATILFPLEEVSAGELTAAVAANFVPPFRESAMEFEKNDRS